MKLTINFYKIIVVMLSTIMLASCLSPVKTKPIYRYVLTALPMQIPYVRQAHSATILVTEPDANAAYATKRMAYSVRPYQISYYVKNTWAETPARMLQPLIAQSLMRTNYFRAVVTPPFIGSYDYILNTHIVKLQQDFTRRPPMLELVVIVQLSRVLTNRVLATRQFSYAEPIFQCNPYAGVIAANRATESLLTDLTRFCLKKVRG